MELYTPPVPARSVPVINLGESRTGAGDAMAEAARAIHRACRETGFFYVANHGVPDALMADQFAAAKRFFDLPLEDKLALDMKNSPSRAGYDPIGGQTLDSQDTKSKTVAPPDLKESFYMSVETGPDHPFADPPTRNYGYNQWPELPGFYDQMQDYRAEVTALGRHLLSLLALSLDLDADWFEPSYQYPSAALRLIKYPPQRADADFNQIGAGAHTDWGGITILAQDDLGGLEVRNLANEWIAAPPIPGTFVVNLGDLMARWTNGIYRSNMHRVKNNATGRDRYSVPFFFNPQPDAVIAPIPTCVTPANPQHYPVCLAREHLDEMFRRSYGYAVAG